MQEIDVLAEEIGVERREAAQPEGNIPPQQKPETKAPSVIAVDQEKQIIIARDQSELWRMVQMFMKGTAFPKTIDTPEKAIAAWQVAASLNLPPMVTMQNLAFIHGSISMWGQLPKALAERTGQVEDCKIILFDEAQRVISLENKNLDAPVWGAVTQMRRTRRSMNEYSFTEKDAATAGLLNKSGPWKEYRKIMYMRRTMAHACKFDFGDALMGVPVAEYDHHEAPDIKDVTPSQNRDALIEKLNNRAQPKEGHDVSVKEGTGINLETSE